MYIAMIREFMKSKTKKDFAIITNVNDKFLAELELQRYLEQENVDIVQINDKSDTATISDWQSIFAYHKLAVELKKINARILHVEYPAKAYGKSIGVNFLPMFARLRGIKVVFTTHEYSNRSFLGRMRQIPSFLFANEIIVVDPQFEVDIKKIPLCKKKVRTIRIGSNIVPSVAPNDKIISGFSTSMLVGLDIS